MTLNLATEGSGSGGNDDDLVSAHWSPGSGRGSYLNCMPMVSGVHGMKMLTVTRPIGLALLGLVSQFHSSLSELARP